MIEARAPHAPHSPPPQVPELAARAPWHIRCDPRSSAEEADNGKGWKMDDQEHPKGALLFMLIYLLTLTALWLNAYLRLWRG